MITATGYSKDPSIKPDGIVVTFGKEMIKEKGGLLRFIRWFEEVMATEESYWMHKCKNRPKYEDLLYVYVIICGRVYYRCHYGGYEKADTTGHLTPGGPSVEIDWPRIVLAGPLVRAKRKIRRPGFQGFRYCTMLF